MRGHVRHRGEERAGSWEYIVDIGLAAAQRCEGCGKRIWVERRPKEKCPKCGGALRETEERRRETKAGFVTQKECQAAMNKLLVAVDQQAYTAPTKASVREYLTRPESTDHPLQTDLTNPGRLTPAFSATEDHVRWPEALR